MFHVRRPKAETDMTKNNTLGVCEKMQKDEWTAGCQLDIQLSIRSTA